MKIAAGPFPFVSLLLSRQHSRLGKDKAIESLGHVVVHVLPPLAEWYTSWIREVARFGTPDRRPPAILILFT